MRRTRREAVAGRGRAACRWSPGEARGSSAVREQHRSTAATEHASPPTLWPRVSWAQLRARVTLGGTNGRRAACCCAQAHSRKLLTLRLPAESLFRRHGEARS